MRPVMRGHLRYESLLDGAVDLVDIARLNNCIDIYDENEERLRPEDKNG